MEHVVIGDENSPYLSENSTDISDILRFETIVTISDDSNQDIFAVSSWRRILTDANARVGLPDSNEPGFTLIKFCQLTIATSLVTVIVIVVTSLLGVLDIACVIYTLVIDMEQSTE